MVGLVLVVALAVSPSSSTSPKGKGSAAKKSSKTRPAEPTPAEAEPTPAAASEVSPAASVPAPPVAEPAPSAHVDAPPPKTDSAPAVGSTHGAAVVAAVKPKLAVLDLTPGAGVDASVTGPLGEAITSEIQRRGYFDVLSQRDIATLLGVERQRQLVGCTDTSCVAELSDALGARFVLSGSLARFGDAYQLTLTTMDTQKAQPLGRCSRIAKDLAALNQGISVAVAEATATPPPAPPSKALPYTLIGVGAGAAAVGLLLGIIALNATGQLRGELEVGQNRPGVLRTHDYYVKQVAGLDTDKLIATACLGAGVVAAAIGIFIMPKDVALMQVSLVPTTHGLGIAGAFR
jgi:hypothetical protein